MPSTAGSIDYEDVLRTFVALTVERGPTVRELKVALGLSSESLVWRRLETLEEAGYVERRDRSIDGYAMPRGWRLTLAGRQRLAELEAS